jgi:hypothetical protein
MSFGIPVRNGLAIGLLSSTTLSSNGGLFPAMALNFLIPSLDSRVTFTRGSNATLVDATGKITYAPANLLTFSEQFDNAAWTKTNATVTANTTAAPDGTLTADTLIPSASAGEHKLLQTNSATPPSHVLTVYAKPSGYNWIILQGFGYAWFDVANGVVGNQVNCVGSITAAGNGWYRCQIYMTSPTSNTTVWATTGNSVTSFTGDGTSGVFFWGAQLEPVTYQTTPSTYVATTSAAYYGPRFDYDPVTLAPKGLLIEEQRTNLLTYSEQFDNASWTKNAGTVTANAGVSPSGTTTADTFIPSTGNSAHNIYTSLLYTAAVHTLSVYAKPSGYSWIRLGSMLTGSSVYFDVTNGVVGTASAGYTGTITAAGNGWYRCSVTFTATAAVDLPGLYVSNSGSTVSFAGDGTSGVLLWGIQVELGSFATSYIPTVASQVTRSADVATMTGTNFSSWYNQTQGTFVVNTSPIAVDNDIAFSVSNSGGYNNSIYFPADSGSQFIVVNGGAVQANIDAGTVTANATNRIAGAYKVADFAASVGGGAVVSVASGTIPTVDRAVIGGLEANTANRLNGHIRSIAYYNTRLTNTQLQQLTAPPLVTTLSLDFINGVYNA